MHSRNPQQSEKAKNSGDSYNARGSDGFPLLPRGLGAFCKNCCQSGLQICAGLINSTWASKGAGARTVMPMGPSQSLGQFINTKSMYCKGSDLKGKQSKTKQKTFSEF